MAASGDSVARQLPTTQQALTPQQPVEHHKQQVLAAADIQPPPAVVHDSLLTAPLVASPADRGGARPYAPSLPAMISAVSAFAPRATGKAEGAVASSAAFRGYASAVDACVDEAVDRRSYERDGGENEAAGGAAAGRTREATGAKEDRDNLPSPPVIAAQATPLPSIPYDRESLDEIVEELPIGDAIKSQVSDDLASIGKQFTDIRRYQFKRKPEHFYSAMSAAVLEIRNIADALYDLTKPYHPIFPNTLKQLILKWISPLEAALKKLAMPVADRDALQLGTKHLYAEQSFISRKSSSQQALMQHLERLKQLFEEPSRPNPRCYISYAWPSEENKDQEYWVQPFLYVLYDHLNAAGIRVVMDIRDNRPGDSIYQFMRRYHEGNYVILVGTESLRQKHDSLRTHAVQTALSIITGRFEQDHRQFGHSRIYPMLISGSIETAYPEIYDKYRTVCDAREQGYLGTLKALMDWIYEHCLVAIKQPHTDLWRTFNETCQGLPRSLSTVEQEIALGYHCQRLDYLRQDLQYQSVEAQEATLHSEAVQVKQIAALLESQGHHPQTLYDASGVRFKPPYANPDFVGRPQLWDRMTQHFATQDAQILTLTAHGLGGMGKTELAGYYYLHPPRPYTLRAWFHAEKKEQLYYQYIALAAEHPEGVKFSKEMPVEEQARRVKEWLESQKDCLLVYDDVPNSGEIAALLPAQGKHHILMTSRNEVSWPAHQKLDVDVMEESEAIALIVKITGYAESEVNLKSLVNTLGRLPLALAQAGAYLAENKTSIEDYLALYKQHQATLLRDATLERSPKHEPVWITFDMNFKALAKDCPAALTTLNQAAWLSSTAILEVILQFMHRHTTQDSTAELLWPNVKRHIARYSLMRIDVAQHLLSMHPLLQDIIRSQQSVEERLSYFRQCVGVINAKEESVYQSKFMVYKSLLPHAARLQEHAMELAMTMSEGKERDLLSLEPIRLSALYLRLGLVQQALSFLIKKLLILERYYGEGRVEIAETLGNLGTVYHQLRKLEDAKRYYERALAIQEKHYGEGHVETAAALDNLGTIHRQLGKLEDAKRYYERTLAITEKHYGEGHVETAKGLVGLGTVYRQLGRLEDAKRYYERTLAITEKHYSKGHVQTAEALVGLGNVYHQLGELEDAKQHLERTLAITEKHYGEGHVETAEALVGLGNVYVQLGKPEDAERYYERAEHASQQLPSATSIATAAVITDGAHAIAGGVDREVDGRPDAPPHSLSQQPGAVPLGAGPISEAVGIDSSAVIRVGAVAAAAEGESVRIAAPQSLPAGAHPPAGGDAPPVIDDSARVEGAAAVARGALGHHGVRCSREQTRRDSNRGFDHDTDSELADGGFPKYRRTGQ